MLEWAASGGMALTGRPDGAPDMSPAPAFGLLSRVTRQLANVTRTTGTEVRGDPAELIAGRAALTGFTRQGRVSAGGSSRLLRAADGWCAVTLSRESDVAAVPAVLGVLGVPAVPGLPGIPGPHCPDIAGAAWAALETAALAVSAPALADAAQLLGVPAAVLPAEPPEEPWPPWRLTPIAAPSPGTRLAGAVVADLSSMWAGPLCARLLGLAGAQVIKVESPDRPDGARAGDAAFYDWLHAGHQNAAVDFRTSSGHDTLAKLLRAADVVIEASRPRALENLGLAPGTIAHKDGQVWLSITGYGRDDPDRVAFGDDAAVAGGLVGRTARREPVFCADAIADPLAGACGALAVAQSLGEGGGHLIDLPMREVAAAFATAPGDGHGPHELRPDGTVTCPHLGQEQQVLAPRRPARAGHAAALGADTCAVLTWLASC